MANPNIVNVSAIYGTTWLQNVANTATAIVTASTNTVVKLDALYVGNIDTSASYKVTVDLFRSSATPNTYNMLYQISIPAGAGLDVLSKSIYLMENDQLRITGDTSGKLQAVASGEVIS